MIDRTQMVERLFELFRSSGYGEASLSQISAVTGLGRSSLYHHFPGGKEQMLLAVIDHLDAWARHCLLEPMYEMRPAQHALERGLAAIAEMHANGLKPSLLALLCTSAVPEPVRRRLAVSFRIWISAFEVLLVEAGIPRRHAASRAEEAVGRIYGALTLSSALNDAEPFERAMTNLRQELLQPVRIGSRAVPAPDPFLP
jgi:TetR/AcrR family transcriptional repressor of lmrAB and yxaGH operons